ncbi:MAG: GNAT family N-acetyltransferase [Vulcanimicrobiota bacterium]
MHYRPLPEEKIDELASIISESFNTPAGIARPWIEASGLQNWRVIEEGEAALGGLMVIPMGQWFGGRAVSMTGLAGVVISSLARGRGVGRQLISSTLQELRDQGAALSALYGSTTSFYRAAGYQRAGANYLLEVELKGLDFKAGPLEIWPLTDQDKAAEEALQHDWVQQQGCLKRGPYLWHRVRGPRGVKAERFGFFSGSRLEGYVYWIRSESKGTDNELQITDLVLTKAEAEQTFLGFLAGHRAMFSKARWTCPSSFSWLLALEERWQYSMKLHEHWMLRIVHLEKALAERGYPGGLEGELHLEIEDPLLPENSGRWLLKVKGGVGEIQSGGEGTLKMGIGTLAPLYSGFLSAAQLRGSGRLEGPDEQLVLADGLFRGKPHLADFF